ncbi:NAD(P)H-dependent glycerol-3-phosphate dehydrogenase [Actinocatenispora sera]|uniref:Glycerol-3-phosphate dehydrogenase [NAD(P)+] n=1 Tax=Actinocatenispora sera TaxID=390989 RepID=A0A810L759_9ACTN|nr:NAD(P)H-dependent glycerol-3-phosphate dehydrogenase [Actinocatenispora sera]BCJ31153.1 glycerol-3-phosphate dehydrogenase [NAD(P)+] [Actinocatenispora sera]
MTEIKRAAVLSAGSWGTTFGKVLADAGREVRILARRAQVADAINDSHTNPDYVPEVRLPDAVRATTDPAVALDGADLVVLATPSQALRDNLVAWKPLLDPAASVVSLAKGIELNTLLRMSEVIAEVTGIPTDQVVVVTGPNLAPEIAHGQPTAAVVACTDLDRAELVQRAVAAPYFRPYTNTDVVGAEIGGAVKNVIALAYGMASGLGLGDNTKATLITRGLAETSRLGERLGADPRTFSGLAGLGDLVATCSSPLSRNHRFGEYLGRGDSLAAAQRATRQTAEGVKSCRSIRDLAHRYHVEMPITEQVERVCYEQVPPSVAVRELMSRDMKAE